MSLDKHIEKFGKEFVTIPVYNVRYWKDLEMNIGEVATDGIKGHTKGSTIAFEFYDPAISCYLAYKPKENYQK